MFPVFGKVGKRSGLSGLDASWWFGAKRNDRSIKYVQLKVSVRGAFCCASSCERTLELSPHEFNTLMRAQNVQAQGGAKEATVRSIVINEAQRLWPDTKTRMHTSLVMLAPMVVGALVGMNDGEGPVCGWEGLPAQLRSWFQDQDVLVRVIWPGDEEEIIMDEPSAPELPPDAPGDDNTDDQGGPKPAPVPILEDNLRKVIVEGTHYGYDADETDHRLFATPGGDVRAAMVLPCRGVGRIDSNDFSNVAKAVDGRITQKKSIPRPSNDMRERIDKIVEAMLKGREETLRVEGVEENFKVLPIFTKKSFDEWMRVNTLEQCRSSSWSPERFSRAVE